MANKSGKLRQMITDEIRDSSDLGETYGKFRSTSSDLSPVVVLPVLPQPRLDSLSLSSEDIELFNQNNSTNTSEYFSLSLTKRQPQPLRLPEFGQDDILVKASNVNNWILMPSTDKNWQTGTFTTFKGAPSTPVVNFSPGEERSENGATNNQQPQHEYNNKWQRAVMSFLNFIGPKSNSDGSS